MELSHCVELLVYRAGTGGKYAEVGLYHGTAWRAAEIVGKIVGGLAVQPDCMGYHALPSGWRARYQSRDMDAVEFQRQRHLEKDTYAVLFDAVPLQYQC